MKVDELKPGREILVPISVGRGWKGRTFMIPKTITKITPKQIVAGDLRFKKSDLRVIGDGYYKAELDLTKSQLKQYKEHLYRLELYYSVPYINGLGYMNLDWPIEKIEKAAKLFAELKKLYNEEGCA